MLRRSLLIAAVMGLMGVAGAGAGGRDRRVSHRHDRAGHFARRGVYAS